MVNMVSKKNLWNSNQFHFLKGKSHHTSPSKTTSQRSSTLLIVALGGLAEDLRRFLRQRLWHTSTPNTRQKHKKHTCIKYTMENPLLAVFLPGKNMVILPCPYYFTEFCGITLGHVGPSSSSISFILSFTPAHDLSWVSPQNKAGKPGLFLLLLLPLEIKGFNRKILGK